MFVALAIAAVIGLVLATQQSIAAAIGGWLAGVWIGTMDVVLRLFGAVLPG
ncbi:hypothetical protein U91I_01750 [alpha proteobacterium U9-1i]|nr:hypothetical protein U91I_01750 [alpha proteobacterium U9-1i]